MHLSGFVFLSRGNTVKDDDSALITSLDKGPKQSLPTAKPCTRPRLTNAVSVPERPTRHALICLGVSVSW